MNHMKLSMFFVITILIVSGINNQLYSQDPKQLLQKGLMKENAEGNLQEAISIYE